MPTPFGQILDGTAHAVGMNSETEDVDRGLEKFGSGTGCENGDGGVGENELAVGSHDYGRIGKVALEDSLERFPYRAESFVVETRFGEDRREARREEQGVAFPQRQAQ